MYDQMRLPVVSGCPSAMPHHFTAFDIYSDLPGSFKLDFLDDSYMADRRKASALVLSARGLDGSSNARVLSAHGRLDGVKRVKPWVQSIEQVGDAVGVDGLGKNFIVNIDFSNPSWWCKDPYHPKVPPDEEDPRESISLPDTHPAINVAFNMRHIHVHLEDKGTMAEPEDRVLWDASFAVQKSMKEINSKTPTEGGDMPQMRQICPKPGEVHKYVLNLSGRDHRINPPKGRARGLNETVVFEGEMLLPGSVPRQHRPAAGPDPDGVRMPGSFSPNRVGPWVESAPAPLLAALLPPARLQAESPGGEAEAGLRRQPRCSALRAADFL